MCQTPLIRFTKKRPEPFVLTCSDVENDFYLCNFYAYQSTHIIDFIIDSLPQLDLDTFPSISPSQITSIFTARHNRKLIFVKQPFSMTWLRDGENVDVEVVFNSMDVDLDVYANMSYISLLSFISCSIKGLHSRRVTITIINPKTILPTTVNIPVSSVMLSCLRRTIKRISDFRTDDFLYSHIRQDEDTSDSSD